MSTKSSTTTRSTSPRARSASTSAPSAGAATSDVAASTATTTADATSAEQTTATAPALRKKELIERIVQTSGMKRRDVKPVVEATLAVMGQALTSGESLNIQPLGRVVVNRRKALANGEVLVTRIRRTAPAEKADSGAEATTTAPAEAD